MVKNVKLLPIKNIQLSRLVIITKLLSIHLWHELKIKHIPDIETFINRLLGISFFDIFIGVNKINTF